MKTKKDDNGAKMKPVRLAGRELGPIRHICAFFNSKKKNTASSSPLLRTDSSAATGPAISSMPDGVRST